MRIGTYHTFQHPEWTDQRDLYHQEMERLELAERLGYDDVWIPEQHFSRYCLAGDPLALASHAAARTKHGLIGIAVMNLSFARPLRLAEEAAIVDVLSRGRLDLGIGRGYQPIQYPVFGVAMEETRQRFDEVLEVLLKAWAPSASPTTAASSTSPRSASFRSRTTAKASRSSWPATARTAPRSPAREACQP